MPFWHLTYNTCNNTPHIIIKKMLEREHITLAITLQVNIKTDTWIGTHNIGYSYANKYKKTLQLAHIILVVATYKNTKRRLK